MKATRTFLFAAFATAALGAGTNAARAQFTMNSIGRNTRITVPIPIEHKRFDEHVINATEARLLQLEAWNGRNDVDFNVSLSGMVTQFNKSWTTNNQNSISGELAAYYYHIYTRDKFSRTFKFDGIYGVNHIDDAWFKNQDKLELYYLASWKIGESRALRNWSYGVSGKFASQFARGYKSRTERELWSNFMAPGALNAGIGFTYTSPDRQWPFVVTANPVSLDALFVLDKNISDERKEKLGITRIEGASGPLPNHKIEGGSSLNVSFNRTFAFGGRDISLQYNTTVSSFYGWMTQLARSEPSEAPAPSAIMPTMGWTNRFIFRPLKFLALEFRATTLYDKSQVDRVQMQYYLRVGLTYRYKNR
jgi:hypothetical protein